MTGRPYGTRHYEVLEAIREFKSRRGYSPSMRDLMFMTDITSLSTVSYYLGRLEAEGLIRRTPNISRSIEIVGRNVLSTAKKFSLKTQKMDGRKTNSKETCAKKAAAGKANKTSGVFTPREKSKRDPHAKEHFEAAVALCLANDAKAKSDDAMRDRPGLFANGGARGIKVG
jgi:SOS-response transcriptional repressor LexA